MTSPPIRHPVRIIGIDPGLRRTGWGVIETEGNRLVFIGCGSVEPPDTLPLANRLLAIHAGLAAVLGDYKPAEAAVEQTFVNKDGVATLKLGQARGVAMLAPAMFGISVAEYAPNQVKKTVVGAGHAEKSQILVMLKILHAEGRAAISRCCGCARNRDHACASSPGRRAAAEGSRPMIGRYQSEPSCPALCRASTSTLASIEDVDGRDKPGHDERGGSTASESTT